ncbi:hypothetical protein MVEN_01828000 [Mycena venus]|uniref:Uncharacterized protein n=1 Tax=Mycena venus TaxID=2733690 RepID=A0A8H6XIZ5_9AGAR|nr:hypothetical protein MVEN_01828000 [Mycena venus]
MKVEDPDSKDVNVAPQTAEAQYAAAARALAEAQRALSAARAVPQIPMISVEEAANQANELKAEIVTLKELLAQTRARADVLQAEADAAKEDANRAAETQITELKAEIVTLKESLADRQAHADTLQTAMDAAVKEKEVAEENAIKLKAEMVHVASEAQDWELEAAQRQLDARQEQEKLLNVINSKHSAFEAGRQGRQKVMLEYRRTIMERLDEMMELLLENPFVVATSTQPGVVPAASPRTGDMSSIPAKRARTESGSGSTSTKQSSLVVNKRARTESNARVSTIAAPGIIPNVACFAAFNGNASDGISPGVPVLTSQAGPVRSAVAIFRKRRRPKKQAYGSSSRYTCLDNPIWIPTRAVGATVHVL